MRLSGKMKKKRIYDSDGENLRERKKRKVMPKLLAQEIDAEAKSDGLGGLKVGTQDSSKNTWTKSTIRELDFERALYRWYERYQHERSEAGHSEVEIALTLKELIKKAKNLVRVLGGSASLLDTVTKSWVLRWQERYGVPVAKENITDEALTMTNKMGELEKEKEEDEDDEETKMVPIESIKRKLKKEEGNRMEDCEGSSCMKSDDGQLSSSGEENLKQILVIDTGQEPVLHLSKTVEPVLKLQTNNIVDGQQHYGNDQIYFAFCFELNWTSLPDKTMDDKNEDPVWLLMAANRSGRHRTRILVTGRQWRPHCLKHVNMLSQPVVYAGGGNGMLTPDLFSWWFRKEFVPAAESLNSEYVLVAEDRWLTSRVEERTDFKNVRFVPMPQTEIADWDIICAEFKTRYVTFLLKSLANSAETAVGAVSRYMREFTIKDAFPFFHKSWLSIRSESFQRLTFNFNLLDGRGLEFVDGSAADAIIPGVEEENLINLSKGEKELKIKDEFGSINLTVNSDERAIRKDRGRLVLTRKSDVLPSHLQEDKLLLLELQWLAHDLGLEVTDEDLSSWVFDQTLSCKDGVKVEVNESNLPDGSDCLPTASEAVEHLTKALVWMETQPFDSNLLLTVRDIIDLAKQACFVKA